MLELVAELNDESHNKRNEAVNDNDNDIKNNNDNEKPKEDVETWAIHKKDLMVSRFFPNFLFYKPRFKIVH